MLRRLTATFTLATTAALCLGSLASAAETAGEGGGWVSLFDGESLDGWEQKGGVAVYSVEDGTIVGTSVPKTPNSFLCTKQTFGDFELLLELKVDDELNSGVQFRSECFDETKVVEGTSPDGKAFTKKVPAGRVHGYQMEIDPSPRAYSGGVYDEARRGWIAAPAGDDFKAAREAFKNGEWNEYRIVAKGNSIKTFVNGIPVADFTDDMTARGFIALQVHGVGGAKNKIGKQVRWRNIKIRELSAEN